MGIDEKLYDQGLAGPLKPAMGTLRQRFLCPPFSVLNTREGVWQDRKKRWISLGIDSELGRDAYSYSPGCKQMQGYGPEKDYKQAAARRPKDIQPGGGGGPNSKYATYTGMTGTSIFDPVLCELCYTWWCQPGGVIVDPFAGGSVRGIVASVLGYKYWGCDLRAEQIAANQSQLSDSTTGAYRPKWNCGDSATLLDSAPGCDYIFSCPPYGNLEKYSDDPADISTYDYDDFLAKYYDIIAKACAKLRDNRFACFVVANYRDMQTREMRDLVGDTTAGFKAAGLKLYNEAVLVNAVGTAAIRTNGNFVRGARKLVKVHQNVLVYVKGDPKIACEGMGDGVDESAD